MTEKGFLHKSSGRISAVAFLQAHREYLESGSLADFTSPILHQLDIGSIMPNMALSELRQAVLQHLLSRQSQMSHTSSPRITKPYTGTIYDGDGNVIEDNGKRFIKGFDNSTETQRWCDKRLYGGAHHWYATVENNKGSVYQIQRNDAIARVLQESRGPVTRTNKSAGGAWKMKARGDRFHFSKG
jgi:hypothetical protein